MDHFSCRARLTPIDFEFMQSCLGSNSSGLMNGLMQDPECLDRILDHPRLIKMVLELRGCLQISMPFYFYILVRYALLQSNCDSRPVSDYVASKLCAFADHDRMFHPIHQGFFDTLAELWIAAEHSEGEKKFRLQLHLGDYALFLSGLFRRQLLRRVERRAAPGIEYFEQLGSASYRMASHAENAEKLGLSSLLLTLCQVFHTARLALNQISDQLVFIDQDKAVSGLLRSVDQSS